MGDRQARIIPRYVTHSRTGGGLSRSPVSSIRSSLTISLEFRQSARVLRHDAFIVCEGIVC